MIGSRMKSIHDTRRDNLRLLIDRHQAFGMELTQGHPQRHLLFADVL